MPLDTTVRYQCLQTESNVSYGSGDKIDTSVPYRVLHEVPVNEVVIERWDKQSYYGESRWIVNRSALSPWDNQPYIKLAKTLEVTEERAKEIMEAIRRYNITVMELDRDMSRVTALIAPFGKEACLKQLAAISNLLIAGSPLDKILDNQMHMLAKNLLKLRERSADYYEISSLINRQKEELRHELGDHSQWSKE